MSNLKRKLQDISEVSNSDVSATVPSTLKTQFYDAGFFPLPKTRFPLGTPIHSKRSRKVYSDLADEREFLLHVKELWQTKLASLKEDKTLLERMKDLKKSDLVDVEPLFCPEEKVQGVENDVQEETGPSTSVDTENQENVHDRFKIVNGQVVVKDLDMLATLQELDKIYTGTQNELEQDSSEEEAEEDDEEARKALHRMLEEFGGGF